MTNTTNAEAAGSMPARVPTLGWALKRAVIGLVIMFVVISGAAWLLYASIDPSLDAELGTSPAVASTSAQR